MTDVILEFGRRANTADAVAIIYNSTDNNDPNSTPGTHGYNLSRSTSAPLPTTQPFTTSFVLASDPSNPLRVSEVIDYQFKVTHLDGNNNKLFFWSERKSFQIEAASAPPPPPPPPPPPSSCQQVLILISKSTGNPGASVGVISGDGAFVAFVTSAALQPDDTNNSDDIYRLEVSSGEVRRITGLVSASNGGGGNQPSISADGRFVAFTSASNFDPNDTNGADDVYRRDMNSTGAGAFSRASGLATTS